jgi:hypothetical protein
MLGLTTLTLAWDRTSTEYMSCEHIVAALEAAGVALPRSRLVAAMARAGDRVSRRMMNQEPHYKVMTRGRREAEKLLNAGSLELIYVDGGKPRTARKELKDLLVPLSGTVKVCDPYYGLRSLEALELFPHTCRVRFLTAQTNESVRRLAGPIRDFKREHQNIELRVYPNSNELHDRYVLSRDRMLIVGHGLKDIGGRESFVISIGRPLGRDLLNQVGRQFDTRWPRATPL